MVSVKQNTPTIQIDIKMHVDTLLENTIFMKKSINKTI